MEPNSSLPVQPTGRRRITEAQLRATTSLTGRFDPVSPGHVLSAFKRAAPALGFPRRVVDLIDHLMGYTREMDWRGEWRPIVWPSNAQLQDMLGLGLSRVKELIREALDLGLIIARDHGTGKRFGVRGEGGRIITACGFDLSPLGERIREFETAAAEYKARRTEAKRLRVEIGRLRYGVLTLADYGTKHQVTSIDWSVMAEEAKTLATSARAERDPEALARILAKLQTLQARAHAAIRASVPVDNDPQGSENRPHNTATNQLTTESVIAKAGRSHAQEQNTNGSNPSLLPKNSSALRGFPVTPSLVLQIAPTFRQWVNSANPTWPEIIEAAFHARSELTISQHAWGQACVILGRIEAATAVATIAAKHDAGLVRSPGGLLRRMVEAHQEGTLRLDRTLFGLVDRIGGVQRGTETTRKPIVSTVRQTFNQGRDSHNGGFRDVKPVQTCWTSAPLVRALPA